jgi:putative membrane protein
MRLLARWIINALALFALPYLFTSIQVKGFGVALIAAAVLGLINALIRPILIVLTLPINLLTLGLFTFVINALLFWFVASFVPGFDVAGFWPAFWGALVFSLISWAASSLLLGKREIPAPR